MAISVVDPVSLAIERTKLILFQPFKAEKWFAIGFCAWLAQMGEGAYQSRIRLPAGGGGGGVGPQAPGPVVIPPPGQGGPPPFPAPQPVPQPQGMPPEFRQALDWVQAHLALVLGIGAVLLILMIALGLVLSWLKARGTFMFLDGVVRDRASVGEPWREYSAEGNSLFRAWIVLGLASTALFLLVGGVCALLALPDIRAQQFGSGGTAALIVGIPAFVILALGFGIVGLFLVDFVVPIMYLRRTSVMVAAAEFRRDILSGRKGTFTLYLLFKFVLGIVTGLLGIVLFCATCCISIIPYLGTVIMLPFSIFHRAYSLEFLAQFGPDWDVFATDAKPSSYGLEDAF